VIKHPRIVPSVSAAEIAPEIAKLSRRGLLRKGLSLGSLALLTGCDLSTHSGVDAALWAMLGFNDRVQAALFNPQRLAETYPASAITRPFRFNAYYPVSETRPVPDGWRLAVTGLVADKTPWTVERLRSLPQQAQITRQHLYRRMEPDRAVERCIAAPLSTQRRRGSAGELCRLHLL
jgi:hypothetical protein